MLTVLGIYLLVCVILGMYWSIARSPSTCASGRRLCVRGWSRSRHRVGDHRRLDGVMDTLLTKPGGYTHNDISRRGCGWTNMPNWEYGVLIQSRDLVRALRGGAQPLPVPVDRKDVDLVMAEPRFNFDSDSWALPASESSTGTA